MRTLVAAVLLFRASAVACESTEACLDEIRRAQEGSRGWTALFEQERRSAILREPVVSRGTCRFEPPTRFVWEVTEPEPRRIVIGGEETADLPPAVAKAVEALGGLLRGETNAIGGAFDVEAREADASIEVILEPAVAEAQEIASKISLRFPRPSLLPGEVRVTDAFDDELSIRFSETRRLP